MTIKKICLLAASAAISLAACKKGDETSTKTSDNRTNTKPSALLRSTSQNAEFARIAMDMNGWDEEVAFADQPNFGSYGQHTDDDIDFIGHVSSPNLQITMDGQVYAANSDGDFRYHGDDLRKWLGKTVHVTISNGTQSETRDIYIPKTALASNLASDPIAKEISRTGNTLTWTPDNESTTGQVAIAYAAATDDILGEGTGTVISQDVIVVDDNGSYNLDALIPANAKAIQITLVSGNTLSFVNAGKKILFHFGSMDHHYYRITN